ncbi:MAG TPA: KH domain-containing protein [Polyangiales bacterium]|nr:KH domain-containing protein [Polyangiales bacterium]
MAESRKPPELDGALILDGDMDGDLDDEIEARPRSTSISSDPDVDPSEDGKADLANEMLVEILKRMGLAVQVSVREDAEEVVLDVAGEDAGRVIGKKGQTLDALQFLINKIVNRFPEGRRHIVLDSGDYRQRRENGLVSMARREAKRAVQQSRIITLEPMSPRDRRVIHLSLAKFPGVSTRSDGQGAERRVRIIPARQARADRQPRRPPS